MDLPTFKARGEFSLAALAQFLELPIGTTSKYLTGERKVEDPERVLQIVKLTRGCVTAADLRPDWAAVFR